MSTTGSGPLELIIGLVAGNIAYLLSTLILSTIIGVSPTNIFAGPFSGAASSLITVWVAIGGLLAVVDLLVIFGFVSSLTGGW